MRFTHDPESGAFYVQVREGKYYETLDLAEPGFGAHVDVDEQGYVLGAEFLSFEEFAEIVAQAGGKLDLPERVVDAEEIFQSSEQPPLLNVALNQEQKRVLHLHFFQGLSYPEIADILDIPIATVYQRLRGGLQVLADAKKQRGNSWEHETGRVALSESGRILLTN